MTGGEPLRDHTVLVANGRIAAIGLGGDVAVPPDARTIDGAGKFLIPGLWDMHVHTSWDRHFTAPLLAANGVTGVREMFGKNLPRILSFRREVAAGRALGPRIVTAGPIIDGPNPVWPGSIPAASAGAARAAVDRVRASGADFVKVYSGLSRDAYVAVAEEARRLGIPFAGHLPRAVPAELASDLGQRSLEHLDGVAAAAASGRLDSLIARFRRNGTWQTPTLTVLRVRADPNDALLRTSPDLQYVPVPLRALWGLVRRMAAGSLTPPEATARREQFARQLALVQRLALGGVPLLAGSDLPNPYTIPGVSLHEELALMVQAGLSPASALAAATRNPAVFLGAQDSLGTIEPGKRADLVLLDANPLDDIRNTRTIRAVVIDGRLLDRGVLDRILARVQRSTWRPGVASSILAGAILARMPRVAVLALLVVPVAIGVGGLTLLRWWRRKGSARIDGPTR